MRYKKLTGVILKKTNFREADQIVTVWTKESGKLRILARSLRKPASKLVYNLQDLSLVEIEIVANKNLPTLINSKTVKSFGRIRDDLVKIGIALYATELMLKMTGDEHPNQPAFNLLADFLDQINSTRIYSQPIYSLLDQFCLDLMTTLGFGAPDDVASHLQIKNFIESILEREIKSESFLANAYV